MNEITDQIEGTTILSAKIDEGEEGMHVYLSNGIVLILVGAIGLLRMDTEKLH